jgi:radical SAM superfamily enzyme YgiQ (UPF0313 family)
LNQRLLLITPPFVQLNTPYPATPYLKGYLNTINIESFQCDLGIEVILALFSKQGLTDLFGKAADKASNLSDNGKRVFALRAHYINTIDAVIAFLQNNNPTLAHRICSRTYLPEAKRFANTEELDWAFGHMGTHDMARHLSTLYLEDISDLIIEAIDPHFGFSRYAEKISVAASSFDELYDALNRPNTFIDDITLKLLKEKTESLQPDAVGFSVPFPGNLYSALKCGQWLKQNYPAVKVLMGGGYPNTELRSLADSRVFEFVDFITLDDGETPLRNLLEHLYGTRTVEQLKRTFVCQSNQVVYCNGSTDKDVPHQQVGTPDYGGLPLKKYLSVIETANPMHRLWSDGRWNKLTLAHGCYWGRCTFCDVSLDYIKRFEPTTASTICDRMETMIEQTGESGFHFVDEAAPPALMKALALEILRRKMNVTWWTNIRFEKNFTRDLCYLLRESGCIAVSGGLEVASDRLLGLINKGVKVAQVAKVVDHFTQSGIMVHAYLMYGFPSQTAQETIDSLEVVRQLFEAGIVQSGFWHHFALTAHSPVGLNPTQFSIKVPDNQLGTFANNELEFIDPVGTNHSKFSEGLKTSLYNYMHNIGFEIPLHQWFDFKTPKTTIAPNYIQQAIDGDTYIDISPSAQVVWLGNSPLVTSVVKTKKGMTFEMSTLQFHLRNKEASIQLSVIEAEWLMQFLNDIAIDTNKTMSFAQMKQRYEEATQLDFLPFWHGKSMQKLKECGLLVL